MFSRNLTFTSLLLKWGREVISKTRREHKMVNVCEPCTELHRSLQYDENGEQFDHLLSLICTGPFSVCQKTVTFTIF